MRLDSLKCAWMRETLFGYVCLHLQNRKIRIKAWCKSCGAHVYVMEKSWDHPLFLWDIDRDAMMK